MQKQLVITMTGNDRVGLVEYVTKIILAYHANVDASRMARLGGEFAMLMMVSIAEEHLAELQAGLNELRNQGFELAIRPTERGFSKRFAGWHRFQIEVRGADHEGIIHEITRYLAQQGANIETIDTGTEDAPFGGTLLFTMSAKVVAPPNLSLAVVKDALEDIGDQVHVDVSVEPLDD